MFTAGHQEIITTVNCLFAFLLPSPVKRTGNNLLLKKALKGGFLSFWCSQITCLCKSLQQRQTNPRFFSDPKLGCVSLSTTSCCCCHGHLRSRVLLLFSHLHSELREKEATAHRQQNAHSRNSCSVATGISFSFKPNPLSLLG